LPDILPTFKAINEVTFWIRTRRKIVF